jgi:hypothetical protein
MADKEVKIDFQTTANTKGAKEVVKETDKVTEALDRQEKGSRDAAEAADRQSKETTQGARETEEAIERVVDDAQRLREELDKTDGLDPSVRQEVTKVADSMDRAAAAGKNLATAKEGVRKSSRNSGMAMLEFSRAVEDAQYGIRGVLNNIPGLVQMLGGGAGLAGAISFAAVALTQLIERLAKFDGSTREAVQTLEVARDQIEEFYKEAARDGTAPFQAQIMRVVEALGQQNDALQRNLKLTREKRKAELAVAAAGQDLEVAQIAAGQAAGTITDEEATTRLRAIEIAKIRAASEEEILRAQEEEQLVFDQRRDAYERQIQNASRLSEAEEKQARLIEELNILRTRQEIRQSMEEKGQKLIDQNSGFGFNVLGIGTEDRIRGQDIKERARIQFSESDRQRLVQLESVLVPQTQEMVETLRSNTERIQIERENLMIAGAEAAQTRQLVEQTSTQIADIKAQTIETKAAATSMTEAQGALSADIATLEKAAAESATMTQADRKLVEIGLGQMRKIMADDQLTTQELAETNQVLGRLTQTVVGATKENTQTIQSLQVTVGELERAIAATKAENIRLAQQVKQVRGRQ